MLRVGLNYLNQHVCRIVEQSRGFFFPGCGLMMRGPSGHVFHMPESEVVEFCFEIIGHGRANVESEVAEGAGVGWVSHNAHWHIIDVNVELIAIRKDRQTIFCEGTAIDHIGGRPTRDFPRA